MLEGVATAVTLYLTSLSGCVGHADEHFIRGAHSSRPTTEAELCALIQIDHDEVKHPVHLGEHVANGSHPTNSMYSVQLESFCACDLLGKVL